mmetsp:Transcript_15860/g.25580  ORF Transcript_15860/g.25580 Transcript_15860/m.25580 type:complete len:236 (-) Transcript_15860:181-888(-)
MKEKISTCPTGVSGMMRMMTNGTNAKMSTVVRRIVWTSRGRSVEPNTARPKNRALVRMSAPSIFTPRPMNSAPSLPLPTVSRVKRTMRSATSSRLKLFSPSSAMPSRDMRSGMSVARPVRSASLMSSGAPRSTIDTSLHRLLSMAPNSATRSSTSSLRSGASSDGASAASSSSCMTMRSISVCKVRTAKIRRYMLTFSSSVRISCVRRTRDSESFPCAMTTSRAFDASASALSRS